MSAPETKAERNARLLGAYAEQVARAAAVLTDAIEAAKDQPELLPGLASGLHKLGRALRQTLALDEKFDLDREKAASERAGGRVKPTGLDIVRRVRDVKTALSRVIWQE